MSFAQVLSIPVSRPIFSREVANRTYSASAYYLATSIAAIITFSLYPVIVTATGFFFFGIQPTSFGSFCEWLLILLACAYAGSFWGLMFGAFNQNETAAVQLNLLFNIVFSFGSGIYANTGSSASLPVKLISYLSPMRYSSELLLRRLLGNWVGKETVLEMLGFTWGDSTCTLLLFGFIFTCFFTGWVSMFFKYRHF